MKSPVASFKPSRPTFSSILRGRKSVQTYLISRGHTTTFSEPHGSIRSWLPKVPLMFLRSVCLLERE
jgi:hypothetical protein